MREAAFEELPKRSENDDDDPWYQAGIRTADWKESPYDVLDLVGDQVAAFGLQLVIFDSRSDSYVWKIEGPPKSTSRARLMEATITALERHANGLGWSVSVRSGAPSIVGALIWLQENRRSVSRRWMIELSEERFRFEMDSSAETLEAFMAREIARARRELAAEMEAGR